MVRIPRFGTDVPFFIGRSEIDVVEQDPIYTIDEWALPPQPQRHLVHEDLTIADGVTVLAAPGHTAGHIALLVEANAGRVVIAGQAVWDVPEFVDEVATPSNVSDEELRPVAVDTIRRLKALKPNRVYAHEPMNVVGYGKGPALPSNAGTGLPSWVPSHVDASVSALRSTPVANPMRSIR